MAELFPDEDVDCKYNRQYNEDSDEYISKNLDLPKIENGLTLKDTEAKTVFPDIIVHRRNKKRNLLAIEVKMAWKNPKASLDRVNAEAYKNTFGIRPFGPPGIRPGKRIPAGMDEVIGILHI